MLPLHCDIQTFIEYAVAPYVGAWIETRSLAKLITMPVALVALLVPPGLDKDRSALNEPLA